MRALLLCVFIFLREFGWAKFPLVLGEILVVSVNTLTADVMYPVQNCENLPLANQLRLSKKRKTLSQYFAPFPESPSNFEDFERKDDRNS